MPGSGVAGKFLDSFLNVGQTLKINDPIDIEIQVIQNAGHRMSVKVIRTKLKEDADE
jgi:hypothetical protein